MTSEPHAKQRPVLLLDVMDTLVHDPFYVEVLEFFSMDLQTLFEHKSKDAWKRFERGEMGERELVHEYFSDGRTLDLEGLRSCMHRHYRWLDGIEDLLGELRNRQVEMHALSNYPVWWQLIEDRLGVSRFVQWTFVSCKTGVRKPAAEAYLGAARTLGRSVESCIFVDDREKNCQGAREVQMPAIHFIDAAGLRGSLRESGVL
jgi:HAD superfamily hydrolase (TIGR01509 family)